jgi:NTE family protein
VSTGTVTADLVAGRAACEPRTAFVLAGGAALGAMQAGMVHALYERGIAPDLLIGTSVGALNAAFLASRPATVATAEELAAVWRGLRRSDTLPLRPATLISGLAGRRDHLIPDRALRRLAARHLQFDRLEQAAIPLHLVAFDLLTGTEARLSDGPLAEAVLAAAAIPGVLPPVRWRGRLLADGGIADNTPVSHAVALGARRIYVLPTQNPGDRGLPRAPRGALAAAVHAVTVLTNIRLQGDLARYGPSAELIVLPAVNPGHIPPTDFGHADQLITWALAAARTALAAGAPNPPTAGMTAAGLWQAGPGVGKTRAS